MVYEKNKKFFLVYTFLILLLLIIRFSIGKHMSDFLQGATLFIIVLLSFVELILMKILK